MVLTEKDDRKKRTAKRLCVTNMTGLLLACFVVIFTGWFSQATESGVGVVSGVVRALMT